MIIKCLIALFAILGGIYANQDYKNQTVECYFKHFGRCFNLIYNLGGNFTARYAENVMEMQQTCNQLKMMFPLPLENCLLPISRECNAKPTGIQTIKSMDYFVNRLCTNKSVEQNAFLNSSVCYNKYQSKRIECVRDNAASNRDAKSLCCQSIKIQACLKKEMKPFCLRNSTDFQDKLIDIYSGYTNFLCEPYKKFCNGASTNLISLACIFLVVKLSLVSYFD